MKNSIMRKLAILGLIIILAVILIKLYPTDTAKKTQEMSYDELVTAINKNEIEKITANQGSTFVYVSKKQEEVKYWSIVDNLEEFCIFVTNQQEKGKTDLEFEITKSTNGNIVSAVSSMISIMIMVLCFSYLYKTINKTCKNSY